MRTKKSDLMNEYKITLTKDQIIELRSGDYSEVDNIIQEILDEVDALHEQAVKEEEAILKSLDNGTPCDHCGVVHKECTDD